MNDWLVYQTKNSPDHPALIWGDREWTYSAMDEEVSRMAARLARLQIKRGSHVAVLMPNRPEYVFAILALARLGAILVPLNTRLTEDELCWQANDADCTFVICSKETEAQAVPLFPRKPHPGTAPAAEEDTTVPSKKGHFFERRTLISVDRTKKSMIKALQTLEPSALPSHSFNPRALQSIIFTSGTTGYPKGAMLTYDNLFWSATASAYRLGTLPEDRWLLCMPLYHVGGMSIVFRSCLYATAIVLLEKFDAETVSEALDRNPVTLVSFVPTMLKRVLDNREADAPASLRVALIGGAAASPELVTRAQSKGWPISLTYGLTEACSQVATTPPKKTNSALQGVGKPLMFMEVMIDPVEDFGSGQSKALSHRVGEIVVRGPMVMQGYYRNQEATDKALQDGWLHTGDLGYLDEAGDLWIVDRREDLIVTGGENVSPTEVEQVLLSFPGVLNACVVGESDAEWGQRVVAVVVREEEDLPEEALINHCRQHLAGYKIPREVRYVRQLPQTATGKNKRQEVRQMVEAK